MLVAWQEEVPWRYLYSSTLRPPRLDIRLYCGMSEDVNGDPAPILSAENIVTMCAWSKTIRHEGEWVPIETYLKSRFGLNTSHSISPKELVKFELAKEPSGLYKLLVDTVRDYAIFALDPDGNVVTWNAGAERFKGYRAEEIIGEHFSVFYTDENRRAKKPQMELVEAEANGQMEDEGWRVRKDGTRFWANVVITALRSDGELIGFAKVTRDLTERRAAEEEVRTSEERFRTLVEGIREYGIFMLDASGNVVSWNEGAECIKGYSAADIMGRHFSTFYPQADIDNGKPPYELEVAAQVGSFEDEGWRVRKDGTQFWANVIITAVRDSTGKLVGFSKVIRDLTERRAVEQKSLEDARRLAGIDELTGLPNRRATALRFDEEAARGIRHQRPYSIVVFDIDHFKSVNDTYGHAIGDEVLQHVARTLETSKRGVDVVGRIGGEEFVVILTEESHGGAKIGAERLRSRLAESSPSGAAAKTQLTISGGIATAPEDGRTWDELFDVADMRMYEAKRAGRNCVVGRPDADPVGAAPSPAVPPV